MDPNYKYIIVIIWKCYFSLGYSNKTSSRNSGALLEQDAGGQTPTAHRPNTETGDVERYD